MLWRSHKTQRWLEHCVRDFRFLDSCLSRLYQLFLRFSADTQPTDTLVWAGKNATLLIHEATMADDQVEMAAQKAHSTFGQAINIGKR